MGRSPCCDADAGVKKGPWTPEEDKKLMEYIDKHGCGSWRGLPKLAGLNRCGKSCRLRWTNYLRPDIKRGRFSEEEEQLIIQLHSELGNKWSRIAGRLPGRTDNEVKNYWNTHLRKKLLVNGIDPVTHMPRADLNPLANLQSNLAAAAGLGGCFAANPLISNALQLQNLQLLQTLVQLVGLQSYQNPLLGLSSHSSALQGLMPSNFDGNGSSSFLTTPASSTPSLAAASPENCAIDQVQEPHAPANNNLSAWNGLTLDDLDSDELGWKDILNQISWSDEV